MKTLDEVKLPREDYEISLKVRDAVRQHLPAANIILYGSVARGTREADSDYDFLVIDERKLTCQEQSKIYDSLLEIELDTGAVVSVFFKSSNEWDSHPNMPFHMEVKKDGVTL